MFIKKQSNSRSTAVSIDITVLPLFCCSAFVKNTSSYIFFKKRKCKKKYKNIPTLSFFQKSKSTKPAIPCIATITAVALLRFEQSNRCITYTHLYSMIPIYTQKYAHFYVHLCTVILTYHIHNYTQLYTVIYN